MAIASVDAALQMDGNLPSQEAKADLIKQVIEEISDRLNQAAGHSRGQIYWLWIGLVCISAASAGLNFVLASWLPNADGRLA